ncbi:MAG: ATP-binding protein, partial [Geitlerinemataceae cyanobacterium]
IDGYEDRSVEFYSTHAILNVLGDRDKLKLVLINLFRNACEASPPGAKVTWEIEKKIDRTYIRIGNSGNPIPPEILPKLTQPFFSTKTEGTGLGLAIVKRIVESHNGELEITSSSELETTVTVQLQTIDD